LRVDKVIAVHWTDKTSGNFSGWKRRAVGASESSRQRSVEL